MEIPVAISSVKSKNGLEVGINIIESDRYFEI